MTTVLSSSFLERFRLTRFDGIVGITLAALAALTLLLIWRGDQVGVQVVGVSPAENAAAVSTRTSIQVTFDQTIRLPDSDLPLTITPPVSGTVRWVETTMTFSPAEALAPETTYTITLDEELESIRGRPLRGLLTWQFQTRRPQVLYIAPDAEQHDQLFIIDPTESEPTPLTDEPFGIADYNPSPDGSLIAYAAIREDQGSDLWAVTPDGERRPLLTCPEAVCERVVWTPGGERFIYERRNFIVPGAAPGPPRLWWFNPATGETLLVFEDNQIIGYGADWSPDGQWLAYVSPNTQGVQIYNINDGRSLVIPSRMGGIPVWSPQEDRLVVTDIQAGDEGFAVHLLTVSPESGDLADLSDPPLVEDGSPTWSPDGDWLAFTRKAAGTSMGKQLALMQADGSQVRDLTTNPDLHHGPPAWSPNGRYLVYQRFPLKEVGTLPSVWLMDLETDEVYQLVPLGNRPTWLP